MLSIVEQITVIVDHIQNWIVYFAGTIIPEQPILLIFVSLPLLGLAVGFIKRIIRM